MREYCINNIKFHPKKNNGNYFLKYCISVHCFIRMRFLFAILLGDSTDSFYFRLFEPIYIRLF